LPATTQTKEELEEEIAERRAERSEARGPLGLERRAAGAGRWMRIGIASGMRRRRGRISWRLDFGYVERGVWGW
jgi:hypothetical protein